MEAATIGSGRRRCFYNGGDTSVDAARLWGSPPQKIFTIPTSNLSFALRCLYEIQTDTDLDVIHAGDFGLITA
jgi:hypothetical protein